METKSNAVKYNTIVSLVGGQVSPVIIPYFQFDFNKGILIGTKATFEECNKIKENLITKFDRPVDVKIIDAYFGDDLKNQFKEGDLKGNVLFNITGGTKPMAIQLFQYALNIGAESVYVSTETEKLIFLKGDEKRIIDINASIDIPGYLSFHGFDLVKHDRAPQREKESTFYTAISKGNIINNRFVFQIKNGKDIIKSLLSVGFNYGDEIKMLSIDELQVSVQMNTQQLFKFNELSGGGFWLEGFLYNQLSGEESIDDVKKQLVVSRGGIGNEIDVMIISNFKPGIISCKVKDKHSKKEESKGKQKSTRTSEFNQYLNDLKARGESFGKYTRLFLITTHPLSEAFRMRAREAGVKAYDISELRNFEKVKQDIISTMRKKLPAT